MRLLVVSELYPPYFVGGYEINCKDAAESLANHGHRVIVLTTHWGIPKPLIQDNLYRILDFDRTHLGDGMKASSQILARFAKYVLAFRRISVSRRNYDITKKVISEFQPDIVYLWRLEITTISPALCAQDMGFPTIFRIEDYWLARILLALNEKGSVVGNLFRSLVFDKKQMERLRLDNLLVISQALKNYYMKIGIAESAMKVLPSGLPAHFLRDPASQSYAPFSFRDGIVRLTFIGRVDHEKGPDIAIKAIARLKEVSYPLIYLDVIGTGNQVYLEDLARLASSLGVKDRVTFLGKMDQEEVLNRLQHYDALLFPSRWEEPFGRIIVEAMAQGLPIIAAEIGGVPEIITEFENGLLVSADNPAAMADAIMRLLKDPAFAAKLSRNAFKTVQSKFGIAPLTIHLEKYFSHLLPA